MRTIILFAIMFVNSITIAGRASFSVLAIDSENGLPIPGIKIEGSFLNLPKGWNESAKDNDVDAITKQNGSLLCAILGTKKLKISSAKFFPI
jgi:hypothetical protein